MDDEVLIDGFYDLFRGRSDAYGTDAGGCFRMPECSVNTWRQLYEAHLLAYQDAIGIYPLTDHGVMWGMTDFDYTEDASDALNISAVLAHFGIKGWVEISRSKGFHTWVFCDSWVPAQEMRYALLAAHQIAEVKANEINPKQTTLRPGEVGNYARLPYPGALDDGWTIDERRMMLGGVGVQVPLDRFVGEALANRTTPDQLFELAELYIAPPPKQHVEIGVVPDNLKLVTDKLSSLAWTIYSKGPLEGQDRSSHLVRMTHEFRRSELTPAEALLLLRDADTRVRKFADRANAEDFYLDIVQRVYG